MTMESTVPSTDAVDNASRYPLDPLTGAEIETAATVISDSEYATPTLKFVMIQLAEPDKTAELTFEGIVDVPRRAFVTMYDGAASWSTRRSSTSARVSSTRGSRCRAASRPTSSST